MRKIGIMDWLIIKTPKMLLISGILISLMSLICRKWYWAGAASIGTIFFLLFSLRKILARPPHIGLITILGRRIPKILKEGWHLCAPPLYSFTGILIEKQNVDLKFSNIRCKAKGTDLHSPQAGGEISVDISYTYTPDYQDENKLIEFINSGGHEGVKKIVRDLIEEVVREIGREYSWEEFTFSRGELKKEVLRRLTGKDAEEELAKNGFSDIRGLGIRFWKFNIGNVTELGELHKAAEKRAVEIQQREGEKVELDFLLEYIKKFKELGISPEEIWDNIQTERKKATKEIKTFRGIFDKLKIPRNLFNFK